MKSFAWVPWVRRWVPKWVRHRLQEHFSLTRLKVAWRQSLNPLAQVREGAENRLGRPFRAGIVRNAAEYHRHFVAACQEMGVPFVVLDLYRSDWLEAVQGAKVDMLLFWPDAFLSSHALMLKDRIWTLESQLGVRVLPDSREVWMYEDKRRMAYWLSANEIPHSRTWVFYDEDEALGFARTCALPVVFKTAFGASASGVQIFRERGPLARMIRRAFRRGVVSGGGERRDRQWGNVLLQEYVPIQKEWRMVRIGDSYFGHPKGNIGDFHSGSGVVLWDVPEPRHLEFLHQVTEKGGFRSMAVDTFETVDGRLLVNELQAVFGAGYAVDQLRVNGVPGRFLRSADGRYWTFEAGPHARNACANLRVVDALERVAGLRVGVDGGRLEGER